MKDKKLILNYVDQLMVESGCTRLQAFLVLRQEYPQMFDALGELLTAESREETAA